jgi:hypothetical protein
VACGTAIPPVEGSVDLLTIGDRGFILHVNCVRVNRELPSCDISISEGGGRRGESSGGRRLPRGAKEYSDSSGPCAKKVLVGGFLGEGQVASKWYQSQDFSVFCSREEEKT